MGVNYWLNEGSLGVFWQGELPFKGCKELFLCGVRVFLVEVSAGKLFVLFCSCKSQVVGLSVQLLQKNKSCSIPCFAGTVGWWEQGPGGCWGRSCWVLLFSECWDVFAVLVSFILRLPR